MRFDILNTTAFALIGRVCGFFVPLVIAAYYGSTHETDAFFLVYGFVLCLMLVMGHLFETVIVPHITEEAARGRDVDQLIGAITLWSTVVMGIVLLVSMPLLRPILAHGTQLSPQSVDIAVQLALLLVPMPLLMAWTGTLTGALNADRVFFVGAVSPLFRSGMVIICIVLGYQHWGVHAIAMGLLLGEGVRLLATLFCYLLFKHRLRISWRLNNASTAFFASAVYQVVGFGLLCFIPVINQVTASWLAEGSLSIMSYALQLRNVPSLLFTAGLGTVVLSHWASRYSKSPNEFTWNSVRGVVGKLFLISAACAGGLILFQGSITAVALGWGVFPKDQLPLVAQLFALFVLALPFDVATLLCVRVLIILKSDVAYMLLSLFKLALLIAMNCVLVPMYGLIGIGIAMVVASSLYTGLLLCCVARHREMQSQTDSNGEAAKRELPAPREVAHST